MSETRYFTSLVQRPFTDGAADASGTGATMHQLPLQNATHSTCRRRGPTHNTSGNSFNQL